jgi:predicted dienelactone hydrolase
MTPARHLFTACVAACALAACGGKGTNAATKEPLPFAPASATAAPDPSKPGPYPVGVTEYDGIFDQTRTDQYGNPRHLVTEVWYPATEAARGKPGKVYDLEDLMTDQERAQVQAKGIQIPLLQTAAVENAKPRLDDGPYPLVIFSHGQAGIRWQTTFYTVALASHGYIVVSPDHPADTLQDAFQLGADPSLIASYVDRPLDVSFLITYFQTLDASDLLFGMPVTQPNGPIGVTGHSFGALTSLAVAEADPRVKAIVPMAPPSGGLAWPGLGRDYVLPTPAFIEGSGQDHTLPFLGNAAQAYTQLSKPRGLLDILQGGHFTFSDLCRFNLGPVADQLGFVNVSNVVSDGCGPTSPTAAVAEPIVNNFAIGFFNWQLRGSTGSVKYLNQATADALTPGTATVTTELR